MSTLKFVVFPLVILAVTLQMLHAEPIPMSEDNPEVIDSDTNIEAPLTANPLDEMSGTPEEMQNTKDLVNVQDESERCKNSVCLFKHANYVGDVICSGPGSVDYSEIYALGLNDHLSSATVPIGLEVTVYEHAGFTGDTRVYTEDTSFFTDFNDIISSFIVSEAEVCFFQHVSYEGSEMCESIGRGQVDYFEIRDAGFNDIFSSVTVPRGVKVTAYEHAGLGGDSRVFTQDTPNFLDSDIDFNDIISSFVIELA